MVKDLRAATEWAAGIIDALDLAEHGAWPTPCTNWDVRVVVIHLIAWNRLFAAGLLDIRPPDDIISAALATTPGSTDPIPDLAGRAPGHAYRTSAHELLAVLNLDRELDGICRLPVGELPAPTVVAMVMTENIVHAWDIAIAVGRNATIPPDLLALAERAVANLPIDRTRGSLFAPAVPVPGGASAQQRLLAHLGRRGCAEIAAR